MLMNNRRISVNELSGHFGVSVVTIRKDLREMEEAGQLIRGHGTASILNEGNPSFHIRREISIHYEYKMAIAQKAAGMVKPGDMVMLGPGSTCCLIAQILCRMKNICIVTNAVSFESQLTASEARILYLGGEYVPRNGSVMGAFALDALSSLNIDRFFIGTSGITPGLEITSFDFLDNLMVRTMINRSKEVILVADYTKFGRTTAVRIAEMSAMDLIITNRELAPEYVDRIQRAGHKLILV